MAIVRAKKPTGSKEKDESLEIAQIAKPEIPVRSAGSVSSAITPEEFIAKLNSAVSSVASIFQLRDQLKAEINLLKEEISIGKEIKLEREKLETIKRQQDEFLYEFQIRKTRTETELKEQEEAHGVKLTKQVEEQKASLKAETDAHILKLKLEREEQGRILKREREDWEREKAQIAIEKTALEVKQKAFENDRTSLREKLVQELNRDNTHAIEVLKLNHQKEIELLKGELKLEQAHGSKFEGMLKEAREQVEKLSNQLSSLSKDALATASSASSVLKLKDIVTQMATSQASRSS